MIRRFLMRVSLVRLVIFSRTVHVMYQKHSGDKPATRGIGKAELRDLVLLTKELHNTFEQFTVAVNESAAENGELHNLQQLQEAVEVIEGVAQDGRN